MHLQVRLSGRTELGAKPGHPTLFSFEQEDKLVYYACNRASMAIKFGRRQLLSYAGKFAAKHNVHFQNGLPSKQWWSGIKKRHARVSLRQPEDTTAIRHQCMEKNIENKVEKYFSNQKPQKVIATKGTRHLHRRTNGNREMITVIGAVNAARGALPTHVIVKGKTKISLNSFQTQDAPDGTTWSWSDSGWTKHWK